MEKPLISVIIPCRNSAKNIRIPIEAMLSQTYKNIEIILVDDNGEDDLFSAVKPYLDKYSFIKYFRLPEDDKERKNASGVDINAGWMARNYGVEKSSGGIITFQDDDDGSCANRLESQYALMEKYQVKHVTVDWQKYHEKYLGKILSYELTGKDIVSAEEILKLAQKTGPKLFKCPFAKNENSNPLKKFLYNLERKHLRKWDFYPGTAGAPMVKREVFDKCRFRQLYERTRPGKTGRGADRDFDFWVAETFKSSLAAKIPLYLWKKNF